MTSSFRVIEGGRTGELTPGFLVVGASEVVTLEGGVRRGAEQGDVGRLLADDPASPEAPSVAGWEGRIVAVGPRAAVEAALEAEGLPLGRFARIDAAGGAVTPGLIDPHTHLRVRRVPRGRARAASARAPRISTSWRRAAGSCRPSPRPAPRRRASCSPTGAAGSMRCSATA